MKFGNTVVSAMPCSIRTGPRIFSVSGSFVVRARRSTASSVDVGPEQLGGRDAAERVGLGEVAEAALVELRVQRLARGR